MRRYKATGYVPVPGVNLGDEFEHEFTEAEERELVAKGQIELQDEEYLITSPLDLQWGKSGEKFTAALSLGHENSLAAAGHIERVKRPAPKKKKEE